MTMFILSLDIGGTKVEANLVSFSKKMKDSFCLASYPLHNEDKLLLLQKERVNTQREKGLDQITKNIVDIVNKTISKSNLSMTSIDAVALSLPGPISYSNGTLPISNTRALENSDFIDRLKQGLNLKAPLLYDNDANCFAYAEHCIGFGPILSSKLNIPIEKLNSFGLILGTGVGGGAIINGKILQGRHGGACEVGHFSLNQSGPLCFCGQRGCAELYLSGPGLKNIHFNNTLKKTDIEPKTIFRNLQKQKCKLSSESLKIYSNYLKILLESIMIFFDPHYIVVGGGLSNQDYIFENFNLGIEHPFIKGNFSPVVKHRISDSAGGLGAALLAYKKLKEKL